MWPRRKLSRYSVGGKERGRKQGATKRGWGGGEGGETEKGVENKGGEGRALH